MVVAGSLPDGRLSGSYSEMGSEKFSNPAKSGYNKGTIRSDIRYLVVSKDVRRHRLISISYISHGRCHGRGREFESRRPRHSFQRTCASFGETVEDPKRHVQGVERTGCQRAHIA